MRWHDDKPGPRSRAFRVVLSGILAVAVTLVFREGNWPLGPTIVCGTIPTFLLAYLMIGEAGEDW